MMLTAATASTEVDARTRLRNGGTPWTRQIAPITAINETTDEAPTAIASSSHVSGVTSWSTPG